MIPGEDSSTLSASYSPLALALARNRTAITQFRLNSYVVKTGIYNNTLIGPAFIHHRFGRTPMTHSDDAGPDSVWSHCASHPLVPVLRLRAPLEFCLFGALPISA